MRCFFIPAGVTIALPSHQRRPRRRALHRTSALPPRRALTRDAAPVDPGDHVLEATAPGKARFTTSVRVVSGARFITATIPLLEDAPPSDGEREGSGQRAVALAIGGLGVVSFGVCSSRWLAGQTPRSMNAAVAMLPAACASSRSDTPSASQ